jgi:TRAP transporter TAXI family solute receptor
MKTFRYFALCAFFAAGAAQAQAQVLGIATMQPGTLAHTVASSIAKVLKEKGGMNVLVQPTSGESMALAVVGKGDSALGLANAIEVGMAMPASPNLRMLGAVNPVRAGVFVRTASPMKTIADLKGRRVPMGYAAMRALEGMSRAMLATGGLSEKDIQSVMAPNVIRAADDFVAGTTDAFLFAFGAPKVREVDATVGGIRALEIPESPGIAAARKHSPYGYLSEAAPGPVFVGVPQPMKVYTFDQMLYTHAAVPDDVVYRIIDTMANNKADLAAVAPALREFSLENMYKTYDFPYHPGALKYFRDKNVAQKNL